MFCPKCGLNNPDEAKFCGKCGATMATSVVTPPPPAVSKTEKMKIGIIIGTIFIPIIGIVMGAIHWNDINPKDKRTARIWLYTGIGMGVVYWMGLTGNL